MVAKKRIPSPDELRDYDHAVAGHAGTLCDADGELFIKPCTQTEIAFYQAVEANGYRDFAEIMPLFMGDLQLSTPEDVPLDDALLGVISDDGVETSKEQIAAKIVEQVAKVAPKAAADNAVSWVPTQGKKIKTDKSVVLENASFGYKKANILDVKLGVRLWADDAPAEKKRRFDAISEQTTHGNLGFRISGMKVYHGSGDKAKWDKDGYMVYDKDFGRLAVNDDNVVDAFRTFIFNKTAGIDQALGRAVAAAFVRDLERVEEVLTNHETRMYSSSLLFIFEGDGAALSAAIEKNNEILERDSAESYTCPPVSRTNIGMDNRMDSGIALEDEDDSANGDEDEDEDDLQLPKIYTLKLIDFAHAEFTPGLGPDENILTGVRSLLKIFKELAGEDD
ncbi:SAICAR synthase-like protein [Trichoderma citrinoviride]|uniref:Kinase n=1 Tax=Trichoderma citrinoviride TaxID=58853 RepID=A0A2T4B6B6_9HYPO|nr:SAICAR synthase-like protein [Trichoderma citrinoviride]PTB64850.1 SAICAR synthase-like protein [Trichoderma citrinoviride]